MRADGGADLACNRAAPPLTRVMVNRAAQAAGARTSARIEDDEAHGATLTLVGRRLIARPSGAAFAPEFGLLAVADLHLGKARGLARRGGPLLPPYEDAETLERLAREIAALDPRTVVALGDSFEDAAAARTLSPAALGALEAMARGRRWIWIAGNHDARAAAPCRGGAPIGETAPEFALGGLVFRHIASPKPEASAGEISGHFHPKATLRARGRRLSRRCALGDDRRVILPAFGVYTGGLDASDPVFNPLLNADAAAHLVGGRRVHSVPRSALCGARGA